MHVARSAGPLRKARPRLGPPFRLLALAGGGLAALLAAPAVAQRHFERAPILYRTTAAGDNVLERLQRRLDAGELELPASGRSGRLLALLAALDVPVASQTLVWSRTALQRHRVGPANARALYFGPDVYVAWVPGSAALELAVGDPRLGLVFYTLAQDPAEPARFRRDDSCLSCHASERTGDEPGLLLRSVFADAEGHVRGGADDDDSMRWHTPLAERWGGWLVTSAGTVPHRGNGIAERVDGAFRVVPQGARTLTDLPAPFVAVDYPLASSDLAVLTVLLAQVATHSALLRACYAAQVVQAQAAGGDEAAGDRAQRRLDELAHDVLVALLPQDEPSLRGLELPVEPAFAAAFARGFPRDDDGTSLATFDLRERTFAAPLGPWVLAPAFARLPEALRERVLTGLHERLAEQPRLERHLRVHLPGYAR